MEQIHLRKVKDDGFKAADPDSLMASVSRSNLGKTLKLSLLIHLAVILVLSLGNIGLCIKYRTVNPRKAIELRNEAELEKAEARRAAEAEERKQELQAKSAAGKGGEQKPQGGEPGGAAGKGGETPAIVKEVTETSDLRPKSSSLDSIDDLLE